MLFETSGVEIAWYLPPLITFAIAAVVSTGGVSGAFLLLPFQMSVLGFTSPAVTPTNHLYNIVAIPGGVYRFIREGRMLWPLALVITLGTLPGAALGSWLRIEYMPDPTLFKLFVGGVLLLISGRMLVENVLLPIAQRLGLSAKTEKQAAVPVTEIEVLRWRWHRFEYAFGGETYSVGVLWLFGLSAAVGILGGAYGVGGGALLAPILISFAKLPVYTIAGACLLGTLFTSTFAVAFFALVAPMYSQTGVAIMPDWALGGLFGLGGLAGTYTGARIQRYVPQAIIKAILGLGVTLLALRYILGYFM